MPQYRILMTKAAISTASPCACGRLPRVRVCWSLLSEILCAAVCLTFLTAPFTEFEAHDEYSWAAADSVTPRTLNPLRVKRAIVREGLRPSMPGISELAPPAYLHLIEQCWAPARVKRPTATRVVSVLQSVARVVPHLSAGDAVELRASHSSGSDPL